MTIINQILNACQPFVRVVSLLFGVLAAWLAMVELFPFLAQIARPRGSAQSMAIIAAALALVAGRS